MYIEYQSGFYTYPQETPKVNYKELKIPSNIAERAVQIGYGRALVDSRELALVVWVYSQSGSDVDTLIHQFFTLNQE